MRYRAVDTRSTEFVGSVLYKSQKFAVSTAGLPGSDGITINQSLLISREASHPQAEQHDNKTKPLN
ncbi:hypothetical protein KCP77_15910 [Salmonella enterica subsp. enterica]|nr:hypothetical protein KCP77_15910 [Salmonella enterica subsp. enterica]